MQSMTMSCKPYICGPEASYGFENEYYGDIFFNVLKQGNPSDILLVDVSTNENITRGMLLTYSITLAKNMEKLGIVAGDVIGIVSENTWRAVIPLLSAAYLGVTITTTNPNYMIDDLRHFLKTTNPKLLFISQNVYCKIKPLLKEFSCIKNVISFEDYNNNNEYVSLGMIAEKDISIEHFKPAQLDTDKTLSFILFSSGTTGLPKGVMLTQKACLHCIGKLVYKDPNNVTISEKSTIMCLVPLFHIYGIYVCFSSILAQAKIILLNHFQPTTFLKAIEDYKITFLPVVPYILQLLARSPIVDQYDISSVNEIIHGTYSTDKESVDLIRKRLNILPRNVYGLTETCGIITAIVKNEWKLGSVGKLCCGYQAKIVDPQSKEIIDPHKPGEICLKGIGVMKGYINNQEATRKDMDDNGFLHTGDMGYFDNEGYLFIVDRIKEVIKYKGFQVSPAQLEGILVQHPAVKDAGVVGTPDPRKGELPTAFIVRQPGAVATERELIEFVAGRVNADKQLHGGVIFIDKMPKTKLGKIMRCKLRRFIPL